MALSLSADGSWRFGGWVGAGWVSGIFGWEFNYLRMRVNISIESYPS
jgi:hypothetical protein